MSLPQVFPRFQLVSGPSGVTAFGGLPLIAHLAESLGVIDAIKQRLGFLKRRERGYSVWQPLLSLVLLLVAGGDSLDDIEILRSDRSLKRLLGLPHLPAATTLGQFLRRFSRRALAGLSRISARLVIWVLLRRHIRAVTLDFDATLIESHKKEAQPTYEKFRGYDPLLCFVAETGQVLRGLFRPGNASPSGNALSFLRGTLKLLPPWLSRVSIRSDSAWYNHAVLDYCHTKGIRFAVTAVLTEALAETLQAIPEDDWQRFDKQTEIAETFYVVGDSDRAYRVVALRRPAKQTDIVYGAYSYHAIITNIEDKQPAVLIRWHRKRANAENMIKELKLGLGLDKLPCGELLANAAYFEANILAYNLVQTLKQVVLPVGWECHTIKTLRVRLFSIGATVVRHARQLILRVSAEHPYAQVLLASRQRVLALASS